MSGNKVARRQARERDGIGRVQEAGWTTSIGKNRVCCERAEMTHEAAGETTTLAMAGQGG
jgi:uncharacterized cupin superfamily protein